MAPIELKLLALRIFQPGRIYSRQYILDNIRQTYRVVGRMRAILKSWVKSPSPSLKADTDLSAQSKEAATQAALFPG